MRENTLLKVAILSSIVGLVILFFISRSIEIPEYNPSQVKDVGMDVKLIGKITKIDQREGLFFIEVSKENKVEVALFTKDKTDIKYGDNVEVLGKVQDYNGKAEILANKIRVIE